MITSGAHLLACQHCQLWLSLQQQPPAAQGSSLLWLLVPLHFPHHLTTAPTRALNCERHGPLRSSPSFSKTLLIVQELAECWVRYNPNRKPHDNFT